MLTYLKVVWPCLASWKNIQHSFLHQLLLPSYKALGSSGTGWAFREAVVCNFDFKIMLLLSVLGIDFSGASVFSFVKILRNQVINTLLNILQ